MDSVKGVFKNLLAGVIFLIAAVLILWFNEGRNAYNIAVAAYVQKNAIQIESENIQEANNGLLVTATGKAVTNDMLQDLNIKLPETLVLSRNVKMYQWREKSNGNSDNKPKYSYVKEWSSFKIDSSNFYDQKYSNPEFPIESKRFYANNAKFGDFDLTSEQIRKITSEKKLIDLPYDENYSIQDGKYYSGKNFQSPEIGDILISYQYAPSKTPISIIGIQQGNNITPFEFKNKSNYIQYNGALDKKGIIEKFRQDNLLITMLLRLAGFILMFIAFNLLVSPIKAIFGFIPLIGNVANFLLSLVLFLCSLVLSLLVIAVAWCVYRPFVSIMLIAVVILLVMIIVQISKGKSQI